MEKGESICIWDLQVLWHERQAYIDTVLSPPTASTAPLAPTAPRTHHFDEAVREYLARGFNGMA